jgi:hypothetical protein
MLIFWITQQQPTVSCSGRCDHMSDQESMYLETELRNGTAIRRQTLWLIDATGKCDCAHAASRERDAATSRGRPWLTNSSTFLH